MLLIASFTTSQSSLIWHPRGHGGYSIGSCGSKNLMQKSCLGSKDIYSTISLHLAYELHPYLITLIFSFRIHGMFLSEEDLLPKHSPSTRSYCFSTLAYVLWNELVNKWWNELDSSFRNNTSLLYPQRPHQAWSTTHYFSALPFFYQLSLINIWKMLLDVVFLSMWVSPEFSSFLPVTKNWIDSKLPIDVHM